jgi:hypothetical protein
MIGSISRAIRKLQKIIYQRLSPHPVPLSNPLDRSFAYLHPLHLLLLLLLLRNHCALPQHRFRSRWKQQAKSSQPTSVPPPPPPPSTVSSAPPFSTSTTSRRAYYFPAMGCATGNAYDHVCAGPARVFGAQSKGGGVGNYTARYIHTERAPRHTYHSTVTH